MENELGPKNLFKNKLFDREEPVEGHVWQEIEKKIDKGPKRRFGAWWWLPLGLLLLGAGYWCMNTEPVSLPNRAETIEKQASHTPETMPKQTIIQQTDTASERSNDEKSFAQTQQEGHQTSSKSQAQTPHSVDEPDAKSPDVTTAKSDSRSLKVTKAKPDKQVTAVTVKPEREAIRIEAKTLGSDNVEPKKHIKLSPLATVGSSKVGRKERANTVATSDQQKQPGGNKAIVPQNQINNAEPASTLPIFETSSTDPTDSKYERNDIPNTLALNPLSLRPANIQLPPIDHKVVQPVWELLPQASPYMPEDSSEKNLTKLRKLKVAFSVGALGILQQVAVSRNVSEWSAKSLPVLQSVNNSLVWEASGGIFYNFFPRISVGTLLGYSTWNESSTFQTLAGLNADFVLENGNSTPGETVLIGVPVNNEAFSGTLSQRYQILWLQPQISWQVANNIPVWLSPGYQFMLSGTASSTNNSRIQAPSMEVAYQRNRFKFGIKGVFFQQANTIRYVPQSQMRNLWLGAKVGVEF